MGIGGAAMEWIRVEIGTLFPILKAGDMWLDGWMDGRTDGWMDGCEGERRGQNANQEKPMWTLQKRRKTNANILTKKKEKTIQKKNIKNDKS